MRAIEAGLRFLLDHGVKYVFGIPAGSINALYDALFDLPEMKPIVVKHETSAGYAASAYTRITGIPSLCVGSSGPGATNLITAAANAWKEKLPVIFITGSVPSTKIGKGGAQELGAEAIFAPVTKLSQTVLEANQLPAAIAEALHAAQSGVPGPVHLAIPIDIQMTDIGSVSQPVLPLLEPKHSHAGDLSAAAELIRRTGTRGALLLGFGAKSARRAIQLFAEKTGWPVATTPRGKGSFPEDHPLSLGVYGLSGHDDAICALNGSQHDVLFVIGSSLGELATGNWSAELLEGKKLIHLDYDEHEFGKNYVPTVRLCGDIPLTIEELIFHLPSKEIPDKSYRTVKEAQIAIGQNSNEQLWNTQQVIRKIGEFAPANSRFYIDIGEFMTYSVQNLLIHSEQDFDIDINFGAMGSGIGGVLGAQLAEPDRPHICITGDGCFFMHGFEVLTAKEYGLPVIYFVINNARLGMVYHGHMLQYERCLDDFSQFRVNIASIAKAMGIRYKQVKSHNQFRREHMKNWIDGQGPMIVEIVVEGNEIPPMGERVKFLQGATY